MSLWMFFFKIWVSTQLGYMRVSHWGLEILYWNPSTLGHYPSKLWENVRWFPIVGLWKLIFFNQSGFGNWYFSINRALETDIFQSIGPWKLIFFNQSGLGNWYFSINRALETDIFQSIGLWKRGFLASIGLWKWGFLVSWGFGKNLLIYSNSSIAAFS